MAKNEIAAALRFIRSTRSQTPSVWPPALHAGPARQAKLQAFGLVEVLVASAIVALTFGAIVYGYVQSTHNAEWSACSLAAQALAMRNLEQSRALKWELGAAQPVDELGTTNWVEINVLDLPRGPSLVPVYATNYIRISTVSSIPPLKMIRVETVWPFPNGRLYTNYISTYRAPDF